MAENPICIILEKNLETGLTQLNNTNKFQTTIKRQINEILDITDINNLLDNIPNTDLSLSTFQINAILKSCPGAFPDIPSIHLAMFEGLKSYLGFLKATPLGKLSSLSNLISGMTSGSNSIINQLRNYATCLRNICDYTDFENKWQEISNIERALNLDEDGNPQIFDDIIKNTTDEYTDRVDLLTDNMNEFKELF